MNMQPVLVRSVLLGGRCNHIARTVSAGQTPRWLVAGAAFLSTVLALPVNAAVAIPDVPLQSGNAVPPNIMFILDDSGSMTWDFMPDSVPSTSPVNIASQAFTRNTVYYNPSINYQPWSNQDGTLFALRPATSAWSDVNLASGSTANLTGSTRRFHVPNVGISDLADARQYIRYELTGTNSARSCTLNAANNWVCNNITGFSWTASDGSPINRNIAEEWQNFATWYSYHRTRMKAAKAGASAAFAGLSRDLRVGYRTIWNRSNFDIPVSSNDGLFENTGASTNRTTWFDRLYAAQGNDGTPLRNALNGTGGYFEGAGAGGPWGPESGTNQLACRQNFAILTTDGFWNGGTPSGIGNQDGTAGSEITGPNGASFTYSPVPPFSDGVSDTLADVAMRYWKNDLRSDLENIVPTSNADPAFWQHMTTFSLSIGAGGTLTPSDATLAQIEAGTITWPTPSASNIRNIDDLWHAAVNGHGTFVAATNPQEFADGLKRALAAIVERTGSSSNVVANSVAIGTDTRIFQAVFQAGQWTGDVFAFRVNSSGISNSPLWAASAGIPLPVSREIYTSVNGSGTAFLWGNLSAAQKAALNDDPAILDYLRGATSGEERNGGAFRNRNSVLGDIVNSSPAFVKDNNTLFVGANDGMLHAFNASGQEVFAFVPEGIDWNELATLSDPDYVHRWFVDGALVVSSRTQTTGKNILVGALGRGGKGLYALDVTTPSGFSGSDVEWQAGGSDNDMGFILSQPVIVKLNNGKTGIMVGNGINSTSEKAALFIYDISDGSLIKKINTGFGSPSASNGLSAVNGWDADGNGTVDFIYAGDLQGNLWKFDVSGNGTGSWKVAGTPAGPIFVAKDAGNNRQPITAAPTIALNPATFQRWVFFGSGRFLSSGDLSNTDPQTMYGVVDDGSPISGRSELQQRNLDAASGDTRAFQAADTLDPTKRGWYVDLLTPPGGTREGERVLGKMQVIGKVLLSASIIPSSDPCEPGGRGFLNAMDAFTGTSTSSAFFDVNGNGDFSDDNIGGLAIGSLDLGIGMLTSPALLSNFGGPGPGPGPGPGGGGGGGGGPGGECRDALGRIIVGGSTGRTGCVPADVRGLVGRISWREVIGD